MHDSQLIFMISLPRSGSTMLQRILGSHPDILTRSEPWIMLHPLHALKSDNLQASYDAKLAEKGTRDFLSEVGEEKYYASLRHCYISLYETLLNKSGKKHFLDKTPRYFEVFDELQAIFPNAKFILLYRNPAAVMSSILQSWVKDDYAKLKKYKVDLEKGIKFLTREFSGYSNTYRVKYESFLSDPTGEAQKLFDFLGLDFDQKILRYGDFPHSPWLLGDHNTVDTKSEPDPALLDRWHEGLQSANTYKIVCDYMTSLGPETVQALGYDYSKIDLSLNQARLKYQHPERAEIELERFLVSDAQLLYRLQNRQELIEQKLNSANESLANKRIKLNELESEISKLRLALEESEIHVQLAEKEAANHLEATYREKEASARYQIILNQSQLHLLNSEAEKSSLIAKNTLWETLDKPFREAMESSIFKRAKAYKALIESYRKISTTLNTQSQKNLIDKDSMKKLTVITVTYNSRELLERTISSVSEQDQSLVEYIVIDGASNDGTTNLLRESSASITHWLSEPDQGIYDAMNKGISLASGEWIIFMNAGDSFTERSTVEKLVAELDDISSFVYGDRYRVSEDGSKKLETSFPIHETVQKEAVFHQALATRSALLKSRPYNISYALAADFEYIVHAWREGLKFKKIDLPIANFLSGGKSRTQHITAKLEAAQIIAHYHNGDPSKVRKNTFFRSLIRSNLGFTINSGLQSAKLKKSDLEFHIETPHDRLKLTSNSDSDDVAEIIGHINEAFSSFKTQVVGTPPPLPVEPQTPAPLFTIVTVTYNAGELLERTIASVISQSFRNFEYLIIDGNSTDNTVEIIRAHSSEITSWVSEPDTGIYDAMNKGIQRASGHWVNFMNAGDTFADSQVLENVARFSTQELDVLYGDRYYLKDGKRIFQKAKDISTIFERMPFGHQSTFVRTEIIKKYKFNQTYKFAADYNLLMTLFKNKHNFQKLEIAICDFLAGGQSESGLRPYLESINILLNHTKDPSTIANNAYFSAFRRISKDLLDKACGE